MKPGPIAIHYTNTQQRSGKGFFLPWTILCLKISWVGNNTSPFVSALRFCASSFLDESSDLNLFDKHTLAGSLGLTCRLFFSWDEDWVLGGVWFSYVLRRAGRWECESRELREPNT